MLLVTTDTIPRPFEPLGVVVATFKGTNPFALRFSTSPETKMEQLLQELARKAEAHFADASAVIGIRVIHAFGDVQLLMGTVVRFPEKER